MIQRVTDVQAAEDHSTPCSSSKPDSWEPLRQKRIEMRLCADRGANLPVETPATCPV